MTIKQAATLSTVSVATAHRFLSSEKGRRRLEAMRTQRRQGVADLAAALVRETLLKLRDIVNTPPRKNTRQAILAACKTVLDYDSRVAAGWDRLRRIEALESLIGGDEV